jgi:hypothetical protein
MEGGFEAQSDLDPSNPPFHARQYYLIFFVSVFYALWTLCRWIKKEKKQPWPLVNDADADRFGSG